MFSRVCQKGGMNNKDKILYLQNCDVLLYGTETNDIKYHDAANYLFKALKSVTYK